MMMIFGHHATIGMLPVLSGHATSVMRVSHAADASPMNPPALAMYHIQVDLFTSKNSWSSRGSPLITVMAPVENPAARSPFTAR